MSKKKKKAVKKSKKKKVVKSVRKVSHEIVVRVAPATVSTLPTTEELAEPMKADGTTKLTIPKTWVSSGQLTQILQTTPKKYVYQKPAKGGGKPFDYVTVSYVQKALNYIFGWDWDFEVIEHGIEGGQVWVKGRLTVRGTKPGQAITKTQFGRADIKYRRGTKDMLDFGNDLKGATSDALKKCASMLGIASDIYGKSEYKAETDHEPQESRTMQERVIAIPEAAKQAPGADGPVEELYCHGVRSSGCPGGNEIDRATFDYSKKIYGKPLCRDCQKNARPLPKKQ